MLPAITGTLAAGLYVLAAIIHWRALSTGRSPNWAPLAAMGVLALLLHGGCSFSLLRDPLGLDLGLLSVSVLITWVITAFTLLASIRLPITNLLLLAFPLSAAALLLASIAGAGSDTGLRQGLVELSPALSAHIILSIGAYSLLTMAAGQSLLLAAQDKRLKNRQTTGFVGLLPPMETMERLLFSILWVGFIALTVAVASGFAFLENMFAQNISHHTVLACLAWLVFALLLIGRHAFGWRGTTAVRWTLGGFVLLLLAYLGSKFVSEVLLAG